MQLPIFTLFKRAPQTEARSIGDHAADWITCFVGSWKFVIGQSVILAAWIIANAFGLIGWDAFPFILLNLLLSFQAAYTAPIIMMSQFRQNIADREHAERDYAIDRENQEKLDRIVGQLDVIMVKISGEAP